MFASLCFGGFAGCLTPEGADPESPELAPGEAAAPAAADEPIALKEMPVRPAPQPGATEGDELPPKPALTSGPMPVSSWTVSLTATSKSPWPYQYTTLTVTSNMDVGPTPYYLRIWDPEQGVFLATCSTGTSCSASVTRQVVDTTNFRGSVQDLSGNEQAIDFEYVTWHGAETKLSVSPPTTWVGGTATVTATMNQEIAWSPFYAEIFDKTTGTLLKACGTGTSCSVQVSQSAAITHEYQAFLSGYGTSFPPPSIVDTTAINYVTWATAGWSLSLTGDSDTSYTSHLVATASADVGPTPYYIQIYDESGTRIKYCGSGTSCAVDYQPSSSGSHIVAFVAPFSSALPPPGAQANSNVLTTTYHEPPK